MSAPDGELLRRYAVDGSESLFAELVARHLDLVYSTALRQAGGDDHTARDIAQTVFSDLARKAHSLKDRASLSGWLYTSTHYAAAKAIRGERRRRAREQEASDMQQLTAGDSTADWEQIQPVLDRAMLELREEDREAVLLRFFQQRDLQSVGQALGVSADAARKRVDRSLERLRLSLAKHGVTSSVAVLGAAMTGPAVTAAPIGLATAISNVALASAASAGSSSTLTLIKLMASTKLKIGIASILVASVATVPILVQQRELSRIRPAYEQGRQENGRLHEQLNDGTKKMARLLDEHQRLQTELAGLRSLQNELAALKAQLKRGPANASASPLSPLGSNADAGQTDSQRFDQLAGYVANLRNRQFGIQAKKLTEEEKKWLDEAKPYFKELLKSPEHFAQLQAALVQGVLNLQDEAKLNSIRSVIQNSARDAAQQGLLYSADPSNESDDWKRRRFELDRKATREVEALLTESERRQFGSRFLGALIMDLTPGQWDPNFEFIDPTLRGADPNSRDTVMERSPATGILVPVALPP